MFQDKPGGLVVDYLGLAGQLRTVPARPNGGGALFSLRIPLTVGRRRACCVRVLQYVVPHGTHWFHRDVKGRHTACQGVANVAAEADAPLVVIFETRNGGLCGAQTLGDVFLCERRPASGLLQSLDFHCCVYRPRLRALQDELDHICLPAFIRNYV